MVKSQGPTNASAALRVLGGYLVFATVLALVAHRSPHTLAAVATYVALLITLLVVKAGKGPFTRVLRDWLPLLALPLLYWAIPATALDLGPFDAPVQSWDRLIFRGDPARSFAGSAPWWPLSELLHAAYLSYYVIIYLPALLMYVRGDEEAFRNTVSAFAVAMVACFAVYCVFPVEGPRYAWPAPVGVPEGSIRNLVLAILSSGSSRGTAFPSSHQAIAVVMSLSSLAWHRRFSWWVVVSTVLLGAGAVYGGFHYAADMLAGAVVGVAAWRIALPKGPLSRPDKPLRDFGVELAT